ncbi:hypothetical protein CDEST_13239 [Colletotrichum destructivum]|uniref:Uncharacterized protein n=1 Tax=Colletotrichum destructivum TaxID=34406 RepID=A0AAX4IYA4_9PEZI|nr:hypothetical protein CDEST_13239 [Colletotrichum destructivum]
MPPASSTSSLSFDPLRQADNTHSLTYSSTPSRLFTLADTAGLLCIAMYHCDITWNTPDPSEDQHQSHHRPQDRQHQGRQSREQESVVPNETRTQHRDHFGFVNLLASNPALRGSRSPFARDLLASHHQQQQQQQEQQQEPTPFASNSSHGRRASGQLRSISPPGGLAPYQRTLLSPPPPPTASSVSQSPSSRH